MKMLFPLKMPHWVADSLLADGSVKDWRHPNATYLPDHVLFLSNWTGWGTMSLTGGVGDDMRKFLEAAQEDAEGHEDRARNGDLKHRWRRFGPGWWWSNWGRSAILTAKASLSSFFLVFAYPFVSTSVWVKSKKDVDNYPTGSDRIS